jgi:hypothetical protein
MPVDRSPIAAANRATSIDRLPSPDFQADRKRAAHDVSGSENVETEFRPERREPGSPAAALKGCEVSSRGCVNAE